MAIRFVTRYNQGVKSLNSYLREFAGKTLLAIFPHPDDEAYTSGGVLQVAKSLGLTTRVIFLTGGLVEKAPQKLKETTVSLKILGNGLSVFWDFPYGSLHKTISKWVPKLENEIEKINPAIVLTFDLSGITGNADHITSSVVVLSVIKKKKTILLWRVPDEQEKSYFKQNEALVFAEKPTHKLTMSFGQSLKKISAIFAYRTHLVGFVYRLHILDWFLFNHRELYHLVDIKKKYPYKIKITRN